MFDAGGHPDLVAGSSPLKTFTSAARSGSRRYVSLPAPSAILPQRASLASRPWGKGPVESSAAASLCGDCGIFAPQPVIEAKLSAKGMGPTTHVRV